MKIVMTKDAKGSPDGINIRDYLVGEEYEVDDILMSQSLMECFLDGGNAEVVKPAKVAKSDAKAASKTDDTDSKATTPKSDTLSGSGGG